MGRVTTIDIDLDAKCPRCGRKGVANKGLCLRCVTKGIKSGEFKTNRGDDVARKTVSERVVDGVAGGVETAKETLTVRKPTATQVAQAEEDATAALDSLQTLAEIRERQQRVTKLEDEIDGLKLQQKSFKELAANIKREIRELINGTYTAPLPFNDDPENN